MKLDNGKASNSEITNNVLEDKSKSNSMFDVNFNHNKNESMNGEEKNGLSEKTDEEQQDQEFIFIHDTCFNVKIEAPGVEPFYIQVGHSCFQHIVSNLFFTHSPFWLLPFYLHIFIR